MEKETEWITGQIRLSIDGTPLEMEMTVPARPVKPQRMLPIFQQMADSFVQIGIDAVQSTGRKISCAKGCAACCRQPVPLAEIEAYRIAEIVAELPEPRRAAIKSRFDEACRRLYAIGWFEKLDRCAHLPAGEREKVVLEYFAENVPCPFLEDGACSIYADRPLACREYLVTSPAANCSAPSRETVRLIELRIRSAATLRSLGDSRNLNAVVNFLPLVLALKWTEVHPDDFPEKTGEQWMADFFRKLTKNPIPAAKNNPPKS
ncbi:MAG: YkgJ family cysteine cluster protein [Acidobacteria bacterium]|nr:YkgJ family cysteine cluster protein [Acidobacteriota bacterium]